MGADSFASNGYTGWTISNKKIFKSENSKELIIGASGSINLQALEYEDILDEVKMLKDEIDRKYLITEFIPKLRGIISKYNANELSNNLYTIDGNVMFGYKDRLFIIHSDYSLGEVTDNFNSIGSGFRLALGSLETTKDLVSDLKVRIHLALQSAAKYDVGVKAPFYIINTGNDDVVEYKE